MITTAQQPGIVVAVDGSRSSFVTAEAAGRLADEWKVPVHLVSVLPPFADYGSHPEGDEPASQVEDLRLQLRDAAIRKMMERMHSSSTPFFICAFEFSKSMRV